MIKLCQSYPFRWTFDMSVQIHAEHFPINYWLDWSDWIHTSLGCILSLLLGYCVSECLSLCLYCEFSFSGCNSQHWPRQPSGLHHICQCDIVWPDIILPFPEAQHATQHPSCVKTNTHVQIHLCRLHHRPAGRGWGWVQG